MAVALTNLYWGIYQRGAITRTTLPLGLNGIYKWLLLFGLASIFAVILRCELILKKEISYLTLALCLIESFTSNVSMLSRGMILNVSALSIGAYASMKKNRAVVSLRFAVIASLMFACLFASSVLVVNHLRSHPYWKVSTITAKLDEAAITAKGMAQPLFIDRWVGIEGVMAVSSHAKVGWDLWTEAWREKYSENTMSFYDQHLITSPYSQADFSKTHYISLPGILAFFYYPGSLPFLFVSMFILGLLAALIEFVTFKLGGENLILCSVIGEAVAFRFSSFGYVPAQSYLLFGTIFLNLMIIYFVNKMLNSWSSRKQRRD